MKRISKKTLKIIAATAMSIFTLFSVFSASLAWFEMIKNVDGNANNMPIDKAYGILESVSVHQMNQGASEEGSYAFYQATYGNEMVIEWPDGTPSSYVNVALDRYDPLSGNKAILLLFKFRDGTVDNEINIFAESSSDAFVGYVNNKTNNPLSSVVKFRSIGFASDPTVNNGNYVISANSLSESVHFVNITTDASGYPTVDDENGFVKNQTLYAGSGSATTKYVGVVLDYYEDAMSYLFAVNLGNPLFEMDVSDPEAGVIDFNCDWKMVI